MREAASARERRIRPVDADCNGCLAARRCWGGRLPGRSTLLVHREGRLEPGTVLFRQGESFAAAYMVVRGSVRLCDTSEEGIDRIVDFRLPGELAGLEALGSGRYPHTAQAIDEVAVCRLKWPRAERAAASAAFFEQVLLKSAVQLERATRPWAGLPATERVARFLEDLAERLGTPGAPLEHFTLPMTRADIGSRLGLAEETVVRALAHLNAARRIEVAGRRVRVTRNTEHSPVTDDDPGGPHCALISAG